MQQEIDAIWEQFGPDPDWFRLGILSDLYRERGLTHDTDIADFLLWASRSKRWPTVRRDFEKNVSYYFQKRMYDRGFIDRHWELPGEFRGISDTGINYGSFHVQKPTVREAFHELWKHWRHHSTGQKRWMIYLASSDDAVNEMIHSERHIRL